MQTALIKIFYGLSLLCLLSSVGWAQDVYVAPGGTGNGTQGDPYGSIQTAIDNVADGNVVHIATGTYNEGLIIHQRANVTLRGAGMNDTLIRPNVVNGVLVQLSTGITIEDLHVENLVNTGRGIVAKGTELTLNRVTTFNTREEGVLAVEFMGNNVDLEVNACAFDGSQLSAGLVTQGGVDLLATNTSFDGNGTQSCSPCPTQYGRGLVFSDPGTATLNNCSADGNADGGIKVGGIFFEPAIFQMNGGTTSDNESNGLFISGPTTATVSNVTFARNGPEPRMDGTGRNGIEFFRDFTGNGTVTNCFFDRNTLNGIFIGGANLVTVTDSTFYDNRQGLTVNTDEAMKVADVEAYRNSFQHLPNYNDNPAAIILVGMDTTANIGDNTCTNANTFIDIRDNASVICSLSPVLNLGKNVYDNSNSPVGTCAGAPNPPPSCGCEVDYDVVGNDGLVNLADIQAMAPDWLSTNPTLAHDGNEDGVIDIADLVLAANCASGLIP